MKAWATIVMRKAPSRILNCCVAALAVGLAGCPPPPPAKPLLGAPPAEQAIAAWPPTLLDEVPGQFTLPWPLPPGAPLELWRMDLLDVDRPELPAWLEAWPLRPELLARAVPIEGEASRQGRLALPRPGAYLVRSIATGQARVALVLASQARAALTLEDSDFEVFCADAATGQPVQGAFVKVVYRTERVGLDRVLTASGTTDTAGRWHCSLVRDRFARSVEATAIVAHGHHYAVATARRMFDPSEADTRLSLRAIRPSVAPGEKAEVSGQLGRRKGERFVPAANAALKLWLVDPRGAAVGSAQVRADAAGAFSATFPIAHEALAGSYAVVATSEEDAHFEPRRADLFSVGAEAVTPVFLDVSLDRAVLAPGEPLVLTLAALTTDGKALPGARVRFLSWGYPVAASARAPWVQGFAPLDEARVEVLPVGLPAEAKTGRDGQLVVRWRPARAERAAEDLLCAIHAEVEAPGFGRAERTVEFVLLAEPPAIAIEARAPFRAPAEPIELSFTSALPPGQAPGRATCSLTYEDASGQRRAYELFSAPVARFLERRLAVTATQPGRYSFALQSGKSVSEATVWVVGEEGDVPWSGVEVPELVAERSWLRQGEALRAIASAPGRAAPLALTLRSGPAIERRTVPLRTGSRSLRLRADPPASGTLSATLVQVYRGAARVGRAELGIEPGGSELDVLPRLLWVRQGEWSGRGYGVATQDRLGGKVACLVRGELVRPSFQGVPPVALYRRTLERPEAKPSEKPGEMEMPIEEARLANAYALLVEAAAADGRSGSGLVRTLAPRPTGDTEAGQPRSPREKLGLLASRGVATPIERWLAARLLARHPELAAELPKLIASVQTDDGAVALLGLASGNPSVAPAALDAALARKGAPLAPALAIAAEFAKEVQPTLQRILASDPTPTARAAAVQALGRALPASQPALAQALRTDPDPVVRAAAAGALAGGDDQAIGILAAAAQQETRPEVQIAIAGALRQLGGVGAAAALLDLATARDGGVAAAALRALADIGYRGSDRRLGRVLRAGAPAARAEAATLLARSSDPQAAQAILAATEAASGPLVRALAAIRSPDVAAAMAQWLTHKDPAVRLAAAEHLAALKDARARPVLRELLAPTLPPEVTDRAAKALLAWRDDVAAPKLVALLEAGRLSPATRLELIRTAGRLGWQEAGRPILAIICRDVAEPGRLRQPEERELWAAAVEAASMVGPIWSAVVESALGPAPPDPLYASALRVLRTEGLAAFLRALWRAPLPDDLRRETVLAYARLRGPAAAPELIELLESPVLQAAAARALAKLGAADPLLEALRGASARTRSAAAAALGLLGDPRAVPALEAVLRDPDSFVRQEAACALAALTKRPILYADPLGELRQAAP